MTLDSDVQKAIEENKGFVVIMAGSDSDRQHIDAISKELDKYQIRHHVRICSAHKNPEKLAQIMKDYIDVKGALAYVAVAGGTDALSGTLSFGSTTAPVISCPPDAPNDSCLKNPPGSSNATIYKPANAARFIAQMFSHLPDTVYNQSIWKELCEKNGKLDNADSALSAFPYQRAPEVKK